MGTLAELKARLLDELPDGVSVRQIGQHVERAIEHFSATRFWFNQGQLSVTTTPGSRIVTLTNGLRAEDRVLLVIGSTAYPLEKRSAADLDEAYFDGSTGQPTTYNFANNRLTLYPTPDAAYTLSLSGVFNSQTPLTSDASGNVWTTEAADLIAARAKETLCRDILKDAPGAQAAGLAREEAQLRLQAETVHRLNSGILQPAW